jgi:hypothetical protein
MARTNDRLTLTSAAPTEPSVDRMRTLVRLLARAAVQDLMANPMPDPSSNPLREPD